MITTTNARDWDRMREHVALPEMPEGMSDIVREDGAVLGYVKTTTNEAFRLEDTVIFWTAYDAEGNELGGCDWGTLVDAIAEVIAPGNVTEDTRLVAAKSYAMYPPAGTETHDDARREHEATAADMAKPVETYQEHVAKLGPAQVGHRFDFRGEVVTVTAYDADRNATTYQREDGTTGQAWPNAGFYPIEDETEAETEAELPVYTHVACPSPSYLASLRAEYAGQRVEIAPYFTMMEIVAGAIDTAEYVRGCEPRKVYSTDTNQDGELVHVVAAYTLHKGDVFDPSGDVVEHIEPSENGHVLVYLAGRELPTQTRGTHRYRVLAEATPADVVAMAHARLDAAEEAVARARVLTSDISREWADAGHAYFAALQRASFTTAGSVHKRHYDVCRPHIRGLVEAELVQAGTIRLLSDGAWLYL